MSRLELKMNHSNTKPPFKCTECSAPRSCLYMDQKYWLLETEPLTSMVQKEIWCNIQQQYKTNVNVPCGKQSNDLTNKKANNVIPEKTTKSLFLALRVTL